MLRKNRKPITRPQTGRICCWLKLGFVVLAMGLATSLGHAQKIPTNDARRQLSAAEETGRVGLDFKLYRGYLIVVPGSVGGLTGLHFLVDTGADHSIADRRLVETLRTSQQPMHMLVDGQAVNAWKTVLSDLKLGPLMSTSLASWVLDLSFLEETLHFRIDLVIGLDVLTESPFTINYESKKILFGDPPEQPVQVPIQSGLPFVSVMTRVNNVSYSLLVNTGVPVLMLHGTTSSRKQEVKIQQFTLLAHPAGGQLVGKRLELSSVRVGNLELGRQTAFILNDGNKAFDGSLPIGRLGFKEVTFDFEHHMLGLRR
jgi:predicted aspartyl protease